MKNRYFIGLFSLATFIFAKSQNIGIATDSPTRTVDVNGNIIITDLKDKTNVAGYNNLLTASKANGNVDYIKTTALIQSELNNMAVIRVLYNATAADSSKECACGDVVFRFNGENAEFKLLTDTVFKTNNVTNFSVSYGIKRFINNSYSYDNKTNVVFVNDNSAANTYYNKYRLLDDTVFNSDNNTVRIYTIVLPKQGNLYKLTLSRLRNTSTLTNYALICEKFYVKEI
ncbi:hypothetical protein [Chryseobacterium sp. T1]